MYRWSALDDADAWRAVAMDRRNRGQSTGKGGLPRLNPKDLRDRSDHETFMERVRCGSQSAIADALEDYRRAVFPERYEEFDL